MRNFLKFSNQARDLPFCRCFPAKIVCGGQTRNNLRIVRSNNIRNREEL